VRWLPIGLGEQDDRVAIRLPCLETDLVKLVTICTSPGSVDQLHRLLRSNPTLLLFSLAHFHESHHQVPSSAQQLVEAVAATVLDGIAAVGVERGSGIGKKCSEKKLNDWFVEFSRARSNKKLRRSLEVFAQFFGNQKKRQNKKFILNLIGRELRADQFVCSGIRRKETSRRLTRRWLGERGSKLPIAELVELGKAALVSSASHANRLQRDKLASMKQLAYGASHEINNPLANIASRAQTMLAVETNQEKKYKLGVIYEQAMRAHEMISDMMLFAHPPVARLQTTSIRLMMTRVVDELASLIDRVPGCEFRVIISAGVDRAELDATQIAVAIKSLVRNSVESLEGANRQQAEIEIRIDRTELGMIQFVVSDNGEQIRSDIVDHLFDPFFSGREAGRGLGFGLSKVWSIAEMHGGRIEYSAEQDSGPQFILSVPMDPNAICMGKSLTLTPAKVSRMEPSEGEAA
jgi:signal transduction histidine kinase